MSAYRVTVAQRPYILTFRESGGAYLLTSEEAQRLADNYPAISCSPRRLTLRGDGCTSTIVPATHDSARAFTKEPTR